MEQSSDEWVYDKNEPGSNSREPYSFITFKQREKLIQMVCEKGLSVYKACNRLRINYSTGKSIVRQFNADGRIFKRKIEKKHAKPQRPIYQSHPSSKNEVDRQQAQNQTLPKAESPETSKSGCPETFLQCYQDMPLYHLMFVPYQPYNYQMMMNYPLQTITNDYS